MTNKDEQGIRAKIIRAALAMAGADGWEAVRFHRLAEQTGIEAEQIGEVFRDVDAIANGWFADARLTLLAAEINGDEAIDLRLAAAFETWLDYLAPERRVAAEIIRAKLHPSHLHHWVPMIFDLSRLVHDLLDVARVSGSGGWRATQEIVMTGLVLATLRDWTRDPSVAQGTSKRRLRQRLRCVGRMANCGCCRPRCRRAPG